MHGRILWLVTIETSTEALFLPCKLTLASLIQVAEFLEVLKIEEDGPREYGTM